MPFICRAFVCAFTVLAIATMANAEGGFSPAEAAGRMKLADGLRATLFAAEPNVRQPIFVKVDDRGRVWTIQYLQYPNPAGLKRVKVDRWSRTEYDRIPEPPPHGPRGEDRITICEDTNHDGAADRFKDFAASLNLCTGVEFGFGGVFVLQAPYLLFYPDRNRDDVPDADPEVLLSGFGMEDAQSLANHLTWGPDGWLYGLNGSTTTCKIRGIEFQQGVWRYHPQTRDFELFCEGGGNVFGLTFDEVGRLFYSSNLGLFWHAWQGAYYLKNLGKHGPLHNPYAYGWLSHVSHVVPTGGPTTGGTMYRASAFPSRLQGRFLAGDFLRHTASAWEIQPAGSTVTARFQELLCDSRDVWFGATDLCLGPEGEIYLSDFYDQRTAHPDPDADWDRSNGRIYKLEAADAKPGRHVDLALLSSAELVNLLRNSNGWQTDRARVLLAERGEKEFWPSLLEMARQTDERLALRGLWALHVCGGLDDAAALELLGHSSEHVRAWILRLLGDRKTVSPPLAKRFEELAASEASPVVQAQLLCTAKRLPDKQALPVIEQLLRRDIAADDPCLPWLLWWAVESKAISNHQRITEFFVDCVNYSRAAVRANYGRLVRRYAAEGSPLGYEAAHRLLIAAPADEQTALLDELDRGIAERATGLLPVGQGGLFEQLAAPEAKRHQAAKRLEPIASELAEFIRRAWETSPANASCTRLALRAGISAALDRIHADLSDANVSRTLLLERLATLQEFATASSAPYVLAHVNSADAEIQARATSVASRIGGEALGNAVLKAYPAMPPANKLRIREALFARKEWARDFLALVEAGQIAAAETPLEQVRALSLLNDPAIDAAVRKHWGNVAPGTPEEKLAEMRRFNNDLRAGSGDLVRGKTLFVKHCGACHKLLGEGGTVGPDLTNVSRADTAWLLASIVDPGAMIRAQYVQAAVQSVDGVVRTGLVAEQDEGGLTLINAKAEKTRIPRDQIESIRDLPTSLMPEKLLDPLSPQERRDLFHYLQRAGA